MTNMYHTNLMPLDSRGATLKPLDIVIINSVPSHYWVDHEFSHLKDFEGSYGLITYAGDGVEVEPYFNGDKNHPGWVSANGSVVHVLSRRAVGDEIITWDFWIPPGNLKKLPFNTMIMNIFVEYPWQMRCDDGPGSILFIRKGLKEFDFIKIICEAPLDLLEKAHSAAMEILDGFPNKGKL